MLSGHWAVGEALRALHRSINMMEETYLVDNIKEQVCFVSTNLTADLAASRKGAHKLEYVLPDGVNERIGYARQPLAKGQRAEKNAKEQARTYFYLSVHWQKWPDDGKWQKPLTGFPAGGLADFDPECSLSADMGVS